MDRARKVAYFEFIKSLRGKGQLVLRNFLEIKKITREIGNLERKLVILKYFHKNNIIPVSLKLRNKYIKYDLPALLFKLEQQALKSVIINNVKLMKNKKEIKYRLIEFLFQKLLENERIVAIYHLNAYRMYLEKSNFSILEKKRKFLEYKFGLKKIDNHSLKSRNKNVNRFVNLTGVQLPSKVNEFLENGPKHTVIKKEREIKKQIDLKVDLDFTIRTLIDKEYKGNKIDYGAITNGQQNSLIKFKNEIIHEAENNRGNDKLKLEDLVLTEEVKNIMIKNDLVALEADKSKTIVLLKNDDYKNLMDDALIKNNFKLEKKEKQACNERKVQEVIRQLKKCKCITDKEYAWLYPSGTPPCMINAKIKMHKEERSIRPIVDVSQSYFKNLSQWIVSKIKKYCNHPSGLKNSIELKYNIKDMPIKDEYFMCSVDAVNMFSNINVKEVISYILNKYELDNSREVDMPKPLLKKILELCSENVISFFNGQFYTQREGLGMGLVLSSLFSEIYMSILEASFLDNTKLGIVCFYIYADDGFVVLEDRSKSEIFLDFINTLSPTLKFTMETEMDNKLNYLDLVIIKNGHQFEFNVHRKPTSNNVRLDYFSGYPRHILINTLRQEITRAFKVCSTEALLNNEILLITEIYLENSFPIKLINDIVINANKQYVSNFNRLHNFLKVDQLFTERELEEEKMITIGLEPARVNSFRHGLKCVKQSHEWSNIDDVRIVSKAPLSLMSAIKGVNKQKLDPILTDKIIYQGQCSCGGSYIGQSSRNLATRYKEHFKNKLSPIYMHVVGNDGHDMPISNFTILDKERGDLKRMLKEGAYIRTLRPEYNRDLGMAMVSERF